jgi:osmotically-inducible protein OsmY
MTTKNSFRIQSVLAALVAATALSACAPLLIGGAMVGGTMVAIDRRTPGTQLEDQTIELKANKRIAEVLAERGEYSNVGVTSYNRMVLITGEVTTEADKAAVQQVVAQVDNVRSTVNELVVMPLASVSSRSHDVILTSKVKATLFDAKDLVASAFKVVSERGTVYLMGRVTEREASRATDLTRSISGVRKVVRVFEIVSEAELASMQPQQQPAK